MKLNKLLISLDSTVFRNTKFLIWLKRNKHLFSINISIIVVLETYHWYNLRKLPRNTLYKLLSSLDANIIDLTKNQIESISNNVLLSQLKFKHHSRDIIIATHSTLSQAFVITDNAKHFEWMDKKSMTPEELVVLVHNRSIENQ